MASQIAWMAITSSEFGHFCCLKLFGSIVRSIGMSWYTCRLCIKYPTLDCCQEFLVTDHLVVLKGRCVWMCVQAITLELRDIWRRHTLVHMTVPWSSSSQHSRSHENVAKCQHWLQFFQLHKNHWDTICKSHLIYSHYKTSRWRINNTQLATLNWLNLHTLPLKSKCIQQLEKQHGSIMTT